MRSIGLLNVTNIARTLPKTLLVTQRVALLQVLSPKPACGEMAFSDMQFCFHHAAERQLVGGSLFEYYPYSELNQQDYQIQQLSLIMEFMLGRSLTLTTFHPTPSLHLDTTSASLLNMVSGLAQARVDR